ncbi:MAG: flagellar protein FliS, partial [Pseudomonadota bacterium]|nr:flagellar protein FliS [Pseudomonadota bacterium]
MLNQRAMNQYNYANAAGVLNASPQQVISLLMQGALDRMTSAKGCIANDDIAGRNLLLGKA